MRYHELEQAPRKWHNTIHAEQTSTVAERTGTEKVAQQKLPAKKDLLNKTTRGKFSVLVVEQTLELMNFLFDMYFNLIGLLCWMAGKREFLRPFGGWWLELMVSCFLAVKGKWCLDACPVGVVLGNLLNGPVFVWWDFGIDYFGIAVQNGAGSMYCERFLCILMFFRLMEDKPG